MKRPLVTGTMRLAFLQARTGSTRLPRKVLEPVRGRPMLEWIVERLSRTDGLDGVVVVVPEGDTALIEFCAAHGIEWFGGSEADVLDRYRAAAQALGPDEVLRVTADCPLIDPEVVSQLIELFRETGVVYASIATGAVRAATGLVRFPDGLDAEIFSAAVLETAGQEARDEYEREHVTPFIRRRPERFPQVVLEAPRDLGEERWTVDHPEDLDFVRAVYERLGEKAFGYEDVLRVLDEEPELRRLNSSRRSG
jgi:spore coat polysaccharide biosynthesis protein SpsF